MELLGWDNQGHQYRQRIKDIQDSVLEYYNRARIQRSGRQKIARKGEWEEVTSEGEENQKTVVSRN